MRRTTSIAKQQLVNVMESSPTFLISTTALKSSNPPEQNETHKFSKPTSASIIAYTKHVLDLEQRLYEDQALSDIVIITKYDFRN
jgi:hypothetical protein